MLLTISRECQSKAIARKERPLPHGRSAKTPRLRLSGRRRNHQADGVGPRRRRDGALAHPSRDQCLTLIAEHGDELAERYLGHDIVESARALAVYEKTHAALGYAVRSFDSKAKGKLSVLS